MQSQSDTSNLLWQLVQHVLQRSHVGGATAQQQAKLHSFAVRLLASNITPKAVSDEQSLLQSFRSSLERTGKGQAAARLLECHNRLSSGGVISSTARTNLLALLARLSKDSGAPSSLDASLATSAALGLLALQPAGQSLATHSSGAGSTGERPYTVTFPPSLENSFSQYDSQRSSAAGDKPVGRKQTSSILDTAALADRTGALTVNESLLVRDVLYACQGVAGRYTVYKDKAGLQGAGSLPVDTYTPRDQESCGGFVVLPEAQVSSCERMMIARLTELGWLFRRVGDHIDSGGPSTGAMRQALQGALQTELADYYRLVAVLDQHAAQPIPTPGEGESGGTYLTLRRLSVWLSEPLRRMRVLALVADATAGKEGGELAGAVHTLAQHGDPFVASFVNKILQAVCVPLFHMIRRWVFEGVLEDPHQEFFVRAAPWAASVTDKNPSELATLSVAVSGSGRQGEGRDLWRAGYWLERAQLPPFISDALAHKILRAGKSINFLQGVCGDVHWAQETGISTVLSSVAADTRPGLLEGLERAVDMATTLVDARVMEVLTGRYCLGKHCDAVRRYLLLGQGDFVQTFMELVCKELDQSAVQVSDMQLGHALRTAITSSCAKYDDEDVIERLKARKDRSAAGGESGWDVLTVQYDVPQPLTTLFTTTAMAQYLRVFQLLWRLKRTEASLASCWTTLQCQVHRTLSAMRDAEGVKSAESLARRCLRLRADMSHFATNLQYYLMFEVMETAWQEFNRRATSAKDLDTLIAAHTQYLDTLLHKALLDDASQALRVTLDQMTTHMLSLHGLVNNLNEVVQGADRRLQDKRRAIQLRTAQGQWGTTVTPGSSAVADGIPASDLTALLKRVGELEKLHARALQTFTQQLPAQAHDEVRFLLYRLDFNQFSRKSSSSVNV